MKSKKNNFILNNKRILDSSGKQPKINNKFQYIIWCFIPNAKNFSGADWGREVKVAKNLFKKYKDLNKDIKIAVINQSIKQLKSNYYDSRSKKVENLIGNLDKKDFKNSTLGGCIFYKKGEYLCLKPEKC